MSRDALACIFGSAPIRDCGRPTTLEPVLASTWPLAALFAVIVGFSGGPEAAAGAVLRLLALVTASVLFFALTPPEELGLDLPAYRTIEPRVGRTAVFPSTIWHRTMPFADGERLVMALDIRRPRF